MPFVSGNSDECYAQGLAGEKASELGINLICDFLVKVVLGGLCPELNLPTGMLLRIEEQTIPAPGLLPATIGGPATTQGPVTTQVPATTQGPVTTPVPATTQAAYSSPIDEAEGIFVMHHNTQT